MIYGSHIDIYPQLNLSVLAKDEQYYIYLRYHRMYTFKKIAIEFNMT